MVVEQKSVGVRIKKHIEISHCIWPTVFLLNKNCVYYGMENYELFPLNFVMLPENKQVALIENFQRFINSLTSEIKIIVQFETREVLGTPMNYYRFYIQSQEAIDDLLSAFNLPYIRVTEVPPQEVVKVFPQKLALKGKAPQFIRCLLTSLRGSSAKPTALSIKPS